MAKKEDNNKGNVGGDTPLPTDTILSQFVPKPPESLEEAIARGDQKAILRFRLAVAAREENEKIDLDGDGKIARAGNIMDGSGRDPEPYKIVSAIDIQYDRWGGYEKDGYYYDKFGGRYDDYGYQDKEGNYTAASGDRYDAKTDKVFKENGEEWKVAPDVAAVPGAKKELPRTAQQAADTREELEKQQQGGSGGKVPTAKGKKPPTSKRAAAAKPGGGGTGHHAPVTNFDRLVAEQVQRDLAAQGRAPDSSTPADCATAIKELVTQRMENDMVAAGRDPKTATAADYKKAYNEMTDQYGNLMTAQTHYIERRRDQLEDVISNKDLLDAKPIKAQVLTLQHDDGHTVVHAKTVSLTPKFQAVAKDEAVKKIKALHVPAAAAAATAATGTAGEKPADKPADGTAAGDKNAAQAEEATWYKDTKSGGYWDEFGGYYDKDGGYWDADGGYTDVNNVYTSPRGERYWPDGSYMDANLNYVDKDGTYYMDDGTAVKPPKGVSFKAQMEEAAKAGKDWKLADEYIPKPDAALKGEVKVDTKSVDTNTKVDNSTAPSITTDNKTSVSSTTTDNTGITNVSLNSTTSLVSPVTLSTQSCTTTTPGLTVSADKSPFLSPLAPPKADFGIDKSRFSFYKAAPTGYSSFFDSYRDMLTTPSASGGTKALDLSTVAVNLTPATKVPGLDPKLTLNKPTLA